MFVVKFSAFLSCQYWLTSLGSMESTSIMYIKQFQKNSTLFIYVLAIVSLDLLSKDENILISYQSIYFLTR